jgi:citrate synthase
MSRAALDSAPRVRASPSHSPGSHSCPTPPPHPTPSRPKPPAPQPESEFAKAYEAGLPKAKYWEPVLEDSLNLIAKLPEIAAVIYRHTFCGGRYIKADPQLDWAANLAHMMGGWVGGC